MFTRLFFLTFIELYINIKSVLFEMNHTITHTKKSKQNLEQKYFEIR